MNSLIAKNITMTHGDKLILDSVSLTIHEGERIALLGENGVGKSTLMRALASLESLDGGNISQDGYGEVIYVSQDFDEDLSQTVEDYFQGIKAGKVDRLLDQARFSKMLRSEKLCVLSGGQKKVVSIVKALAQGRGFLFLDEPENHLDYPTRQWLIDTLISYRGALLFVSHDQYMIDALATKITEVADASLSVFAGDYHSYREEKIRQFQGRHKEWRHYEDEIVRHKEMVNRLRDNARANSKNASKYQAKKHKLEKLEAGRKERPRLEQKRMKINTGKVDRKRGKKIVHIEEMSLRYGDNTLYDNASASLSFGEKVCLYGDNGTGKTSLFRMIESQLDPTSGVVKLGIGVRLGYFSQEHLDILDQTRTPIEVLTNVVRGSEGKVRSILSKFLIGKDAVNRKVSTLSGGEKSRLRFAILFSQDIDFLLLDEPTNHLDRLSWMVLVEAIQTFSGTVLYVSHDRSFIDDTVTKLWVIENRKIEEFPGNLSEYIER